MVEAVVVGFNVEGEGIFSEGHVFEPMSYSKLCETVAFQSCRMGGPPLRTHRRIDNITGLIQYVDFYCPHGRQHAEDNGAN